MLKAMNM